MSSACSPGRSRGRSTVGRRHLAFQVAGLYRRQPEEEEVAGRKRRKRKRDKRSANRWQLTGGLPRVVWELSVQSALHEILHVRQASDLLPTPHPHFLSHSTERACANVLPRTHSPSSRLFPCSKCLKAALPAPLPADLRVCGMNHKPVQIELRRCTI